MFRFQAQTARDASGARHPRRPKAKSVSGHSRRFGSPSMTSGFPPKSGHRHGRLACLKSARGTFGQALLYISELMATEIAPAGALPPEVASAQRSAAGRPSTRSPFPGGAVLDFFRVRCSANRSGDPIVAEKRPDYYAINYPELQARIEIAHRPLIEVNDAARR
jgi:hypothetical protein